MFLLEEIVLSFILYKMEMWGWKEWEEIERIQETYVWTLNIDSQTQKLNI